MHRATEFFLPAKGAAKELASLKYQASRFKHGVDIKYTEQDVKFIASKYPSAELPRVFSAKDRESFNEVLGEALSDVLNGSTPGYPLNSTYANMGQIKNNPEALGWLYDQAYELFKFLTTVDITSWKAEDIYRKLGIVIHLFIKDELHIKEKVDKERFRLIFSVPIMMNLMERIACSQQNKLEIASWKVIPSKPGLGFTDQMTRDLYNYATVHGLKNSTDKSGWDWTVNGVFMDFDRDVRIELVKGQDGAEDFAFFMRNVNHLMTHKVIALSDGTLIAQTFSGVMPSGSYRTSSTNSRMRVMARYLAFGDTNIMTMGDDSVEGDYYGKDPYLAYSELGFILKESVVYEEGFEFCSKIFEYGLARPMDPYKMLVRYYVKEGYNDLQVYGALVDELRHCDKSVIADLWLSDSYVEVD